MVNTLLLDKRIDESGLKQSFIIDKIGITRQAFIKKKQNAIPFRTAEVYVICDLLGINDDADKKDIFFA